MKKIFLPLFALLFYITPSISEGAILENTKKTIFDISVSDITYYEDIKKTQFSLNIEDVTNPQNITYWKVRTYCDDKITIQLNASSTNDCNKTIRLNSITNNTIPFLFKNKTNKSKDFSIKVKAFDKDGKGLHSEKIGFGWK